jgi:glyoxylase-like metal-dependent hydrolase (beta-lactamase superfamily II)
MEVVADVHRVPGIRGANVYLLLGQELSLVDCGMPGSAPAILSYIQGLGREPAELTRIILTHYHVDHVGSLDAIRQRTGARVLAHAGDASVIAGERAQPAPGGVLRFLFRLLPSLSRADGVAVDEILDDGSHLDVLGGATIVHAPGHTPGSITLFAPNQHALLCGDVINRRGGRLGLPPQAFTVDPEQALASIRRLAALDFEVLCPGHGPPLVGGAAEQVRAWLEDLDEDG